MFKVTLQSIRMLIVLTVLTGVIYPLLVTLVGGVVYPAQAAGSVQVVNGQAVGSSLIAQPFSTDRYFWPRPSAAGYGIAADGSLAASGASNAGPTNATLARAITDRTDAFRKGNGLAADAAVPPEMVTASGSGLDPHISPEAARLQIERVATARGLDAAKVSTLVDQYTDEPQLFIFGQPRVNVLMLNLALDAMK